MERLVFAGVLFSVVLSGCKLRQPEPSSEGKSGRTLHEMMRTMKRGAKGTVKYTDEVADRVAKAVQKGDSDEMLALIREARQANELTVLVDALHKVEYGKFAKVESLMDHTLGLGFDEIALVDKLIITSRRNKILFHSSPTLADQRLFKEVDEAIDELNNFYINMRKLSSASEDNYRFLQDDIRQWTPDSSTTGRWYTNLRHVFENTTTSFRFKYLENKISQIMDEVSSNKEMKFMTYSSATKKLTKTDIIPRYRVVAERHFSNRAFTIYDVDESISQLRLKITNQYANPKNSNKNFIEINNHISMQLSSDLDELKNLADYLRDTL